MSLSLTPKEDTRKKRRTQVATVVPFGMDSKLWALGFELMNAQIVVGKFSKTTARLGF